MAKCNCDLCKRGRKFNEIIKKIRIDSIRSEDIKWLEDLYSYLMDIEFLLDMIKNIDQHKKEKDKIDAINNN